MSKIFKTYRYKLKLTNEQEARVSSWIGACRCVYNLALETKIEAYKKGINLSRIDLQNQLRDLREFDWIKDVPYNTLADVTIRLEGAYSKFFKMGGFPKWAKKERFSSIAFRKGIKATKKGFILQKIGEVKVFKDRMPKGEIKRAVIKKENKFYFLSVIFESKSTNSYPVSKSQAVGLDMGLKVFLADSNGCFLDNPRHTKKYEARLRTKSREFSRKKLDSKTRLKVKSELINLHIKIRSCRNDFTNKVSHSYIKTNSMIVCEDLNVKNMFRNSHLSKHIADASWSVFFEKLKYKALWYEKKFIQVNPKYTSQKCSSCGFVSEKNRKTQSLFACVSCGHSLNADTNASINILGLGKAFVRQREAIACA